MSILLTTSSPLGKTIFSGGRELSVDGKGLNQSVAMAKAGLPVWHAGILGNDSELLLDTLKINGVNTRLSRRENAQPGHTIIQVDAVCQSSIILFGGIHRCLSKGATPSIPLPSELEES